MTREQQLMELSAACRDLGAEVRYCPEYGHLTAIFWEGSMDEARALSAQRTIQRLTACYPRLVCYCFDAFSTLIYAI